VVDAAVIGLAVARRADVVTSDARDLSRLAAAVRVKLRLVEV
jgi:hypothetical protein